LTAHFRALGDRVSPLQRSRHFDPQPPPSWNPAEGWVQLDAADPPEAVIHLAGENIGRRWSPELKAHLRSSRVDATRLLCQALARLPKPPGLILSASATGLYGDRGGEEVDETASVGTGFLAELCRDWEAAAAPAVARGIRVIHLRLGIVIARGGAVAKMLPAFRLGLGGRIGSGEQYWSWIALADALAAMEHLLGTKRWSGPVNLVSPFPVTNDEFTRTFGRVLHRPVFLPLPAFAARFLLGQMADETLLASVRVKPARLLQDDFRFEFPDLESALRHVLPQSHT
jgi:uncharacterized protein (TIGR01777 family)